MKLPSIDLPACFNTPSLVSHTPPTHLTPIRVMFDEGARKRPRSGNLLDVLSRKGTRFEVNIQFTSPLGEHPAARKSWPHGKDRQKRTTRNFSFYFFFSIQVFSLELGKCLDNNCGFEEKEAPTSNGQVHSKLIIEGVRFISQALLNSNNSTKCVSSSFPHQFHEVPNWITFSLIPWIIHSLPFTTCLSHAMPCQVDNDGVAELDSFFFINEKCPSPDSESDEKETNWSLAADNLNSA